MPVIKKRKPGQYLHWRLRAAEARDMEAVSALLAASDLPVEDIAGQLGENYVVAEKGGELLGVAGMEVHGRHGLLRSVAVTPKLRDHGLGRDLSLNRLEWARDKGIDSIYLLTMSAESYFARHGFVPVAREDAPEEIKASSQFSTLCPSSAVLMRYAGKNAAQTIRDHVRTYYGRAAKDAQAGRNACCGGTCNTENPITSELYQAGELDGIPEDAIRASLGCGNPALLAELRAGETVLDLGAGGGIDVLLSARRVGPTGKAYGLDMTDEMLALARENQRKAGITNVEFLQGEIEHMPLPDASVDVIISNCVINLSADKARVLREAFRVLKPGGRFAVSDVVVRREIPPVVRRNMELWAGCVAGALHERAYRALLGEAGFEKIEVVPTRIYSAEDAGLLTPGVELDEKTLRELDGAFMSAFVRATKAKGGA
jgi:N-acetylglutamate synthase-like GNAT family acetyltransferase/SAM-dependent methyltransferase